MYIPKFPRFHGSVDPLWPTKHVMIPRGLAPHLQAQRLTVASPVCGVLHQATSATLGTRCNREGL